MLQSQSQKIKKEERVAPQPEKKDRERRVIKTLRCRISNVIIDNENPKKSFVVLTPFKKTGVRLCGSITCSYTNITTPRKKLKRSTPVKAFNIHFIPKKGWRAGGAMVLDGKMN